MWAYLVCPSSLYTLLLVRANVPQGLTPLLRCVKRKPTRGQPPLCVMSKCRDEEPIPHIVSFWKARTRRGEPPLLRCVKRDMLDKLGTNSPLSLVSGVIVVVVDLNTYCCPLMSHPSGWLCIFAKVHDLEQFRFLAMWAWQASSP